MGEISLVHEQPGSYRWVCIGNLVARGNVLPIAILLYVVAAVIGGAVLGVIASRLSGVYLALLTLLFSFSVLELIAFFGGFTGGIDGIPVFVVKAVALPRVNVGLS